MPQYRNPDFRSLPRGLAAIFDRQGAGSFFGLPQWYDLMARFGVPEGTETRVFADERVGSSAAAVLQVAVDKGRRDLASLANFYSVEHGLAAAADTDLTTGLTAILSEIQDDRPRWDCLSLGELDPRDREYRTLYRALRGAGYLVECVPASGTWYEDTAGLDFADYVAARPSGLRNTWRRKRRSLDRSARLRTAFLPGNIGLDQAIADYQTVYAASWKQAEAFPRFIPALIGLAAELEALRLGIYYIDGFPAAAQFWIVWRGRAVIYKLAHDRRLDELSLGTLLTMEMIERALDRDRPREINFGRGDDPYKKLWLPRRRQRWLINASNPRTAAGLAFGLKREAAKLYHRLHGQPTMPPIHDATP